MADVVPLLDGLTRAQKLAVVQAERCRRDFGFWLTQASPPPWRWDWAHLAYIRTFLNRVTTGEIKRLMISMGPQHGKSEQVTVRYPMWRLEHDPSLRVAVAGYNLDHASDFSRKMRTIAEERKLPLNKNVQAVEHWETKSGGGIRAVGVGTGITGKPVDLLVLDDPVKPLAADCPIPTPTGWTTMGDLKMGDQVFDHAGKPCNVVAVTDQYIAPRHRVWFSDKSYIDTHPDHLWMALDRRSQAVYNSGIGGAKDKRCRRTRYEDDWWKWKTRGKSSVSQVTTRHIASTLTARETMRNWSIPNAFPLQLPEVELPIDPYILGYWLGDGDSRDSVVTADAKDMPHFLVQVSHAGYVTHSVKKSNGNAMRAYFSTVASKQNKWADSMSRRLRQLGLRNNKHIPAIYLRASIAQRLELLRGLMDSDGTIEKDHGEVSFCNTNKNLADGVYELIVSLGGKAGRHHRPAAKKIAYHVRGFMPFQAFRLPRKMLRHNSIGQIRRVNRTITNVEVLEETKHLCITVDSESHLFLAGKSMVPTCNSRKEAESESYRKDVKNWYSNDLYTRLQHNSAIILIMTRWHTDDLAGWILKSPGGKDWTVINLPAEAEENDPLGRAVGDALCSERYTKEDLLDRRAVLGSYHYNALYQGRPMPREGGMFKTEWFSNVVLSVPDGCTFTRAWDKACLVAGTKITTARGDIPIEQVTSEDKVLTRRGYQKVIWAGKTKNVSKTTLAKFSNGAVLEGTGDHRVWTANRRWVRLDSLRHGDYNISLRRNSRWESDCPTQKSFALVEPITAGVQGNATSKDVSESTAESSGIFFTGPSGEAITARSLSSTMFITGMEIGTTTPLKIWSISREISTSQGIRIGEIKKTVLSRRERRQKSGGRITLNHLNTKSSVGSAGWRHGEPSRLLNACVLNAARSSGFGVLVAGQRNSARAVAKPSIAHRNLLTVNAPSVENISEDGMALGAAHPVVALSGDGTIPVYDIQVETDHEFFANGILVHNSTQDDGDFSVGALLARDPDGHYFIVDIVRGQWSAKRREDVMRETAEADEARYGHVRVFVEQEGGSGGKESAETTVKNLAGFSVTAKRSTGQKAVRAEPFAAQAEAGNVSLVAGQWHGTFLEEMSTFPMGEHDDIVDSCSASFNQLALRRSVYEDRGLLVFG